MSFIYLYEMIKVVVPGPCIFFWILASIAEDAAGIPNGAKIFFAKGTATFINGFDNLTTLPSTLNYFRNLSFNTAKFCVSRHIAVKYTS